MNSVRKRGTAKRAEKAITGGIDSEEAIFKNEDMFRTLAEMSSAVIFVYQDENLVYVNPAGEKITGFSRDELLRKKFWECAHPDYQGLLRERGLARQRGEPVLSHYEIRFLTKGGETRWADLSAAYIELNGKPAGMATFIDITERKNAEEAFRQVNRVVESCPVIVFSWKAPQGSPVVLIAGNVEQFGYTREEFQSGATPYISVVHPEDLERVVAEVLEYSASGTDQFRQEFRIITKDGQVRWVDDRTVVERDAMGNITNYQGIIIDITGRKQAEEALKESEERLRLCIATAGLGSYDSDLVNDRHIWSPETYDIYGVPQDTPLTLEYIHGLVVPEDLQDELFASEMNPATSHGGYLMEYRIRRPSDGTIRWVYTRTRIFFSGEGAERRAVRLLGVIQDITERKQAEEALRESYALLDTITSNTPDQVYVKDREGRFIFANPAVFDSFKEPPEAVLGKHPSEFYHDAATLATIMENDRKIMESGGTRILEETALTPQGPRTYLSTKTPRRNDGGEVVGLIGISRDITERKNAEQALRESEERLKQSVAISHLGMFDWDIVNDRHVWSPETYEIFGVPREMPLTFDLIKKLYYDDDIRDEQFVAKLDPLINYSEFPFEYRIYRLSDGAIRWINQGMSIFFDGTGQERRAVRVLGVVQDITERKQAEVALRESEERLRLCNAAARLGTLDWDPIHDRHVWSPEIFEIFGLPPDTVLTLDLITDMVYPGDRLDDAFAAGMSPSGPGEFAMEYRIIRASDRAVRWVRQTMRVIFEGEGAARHAVRALGIVQDITERKKAEEALSIAKAQAELYLDLMGHDINNINQVALGYLELAADTIRSGGKIGEDKIELIEKPIASLNNSSKLIDKVMKLKRLKARGPGHYPIDISRVLARTKDRYSRQAGRDITINYEPPVECTVMADELVDEIFLNLVDNSIKHSHIDRPLVIDIIQTTFCEDGGKCVRISIEDNGPGISDEVKEKIFERFSRGETQAMGKGLGLYLVKMLVEDFNGKLWVEDRVAGDHTKGVKFVVVLPVV